MLSRWVFLLFVVLALVQVVVPQKNGGGGGNRGGGGAPKGGGGGPPKSGGGGPPRQGGGGAPSRPEPPRNSQPPRQSSRPEPPRNQPQQSRRPEPPRTSDRGPFNGNGPRPTFSSRPGDNRPGDRGPTFGSRPGDGPRPTFTNRPGDRGPTFGSRPGDGARPTWGGDRPGDRPGWNGNRDQPRPTFGNSPRPTWYDGNRDGNRPNGWDGNRPNNGWDGNRDGYRNRPDPRWGQIPDRPQWQPYGNPWDRPGYDGPRPWGDGCRGCQNPYRTTTYLGPIPPQPTWYDNNWQNNPWANRPPRTVYTTWDSGYYGGAPAPWVTLPGPILPRITLAPPEIPRAPNCAWEEITSGSIVETELTFTDTITQPPEDAVITVYVDPDSNNVSTDWGPVETVYEIFVYTTTATVDVVQTTQNCW